MDSRLSKCDDWSFCIRHKLSEHSELIGHTASIRGLIGNFLAQGVVTWTAVCQAPLSLGSPGNNTGVSCHASSRGSSPPGDQTCLLCFLHCGQILHLQIHQGSPAQGGEDSISSDALSFYDWTGTGKLASVTLLFQGTNSDQRPSSMTITFKFLCI